jgi:hypothetical protein
VSRGAARHGAALQVAGAMRGASRLFFICRVTAASFIQASVPGAALSALFFCQLLSYLDDLMRSHGTRRFRTVHEHCTKLKKT